MKVKANLKNLRISPRKVRLVINLIKGMDVQNALVQLTHLVKGSSRNVEKLLLSAIANAENNFGLDRNNLWVADVQVGEGATLKRWLPRAHGRATPIMKRTSNIYLVLEEKIEQGGKKRKVQKIENKQNVSTDKNKDKKNKTMSIGKSETVKKIIPRAQNKTVDKKVFQRKSV